MALKPGTVSKFDGSLADEIERAFAAEFYALKSKELPQTGKDERRVLFTAVAQAVLSYLAANPSDLKVSVTGGGNQYTGTVQLNAPWISLSAPFNAVNVDAGGFPSGASITLTWEEPHDAITTVNAGTDGKFSTTVQFGGRTGLQAISAVDGNGNRAIGTVTI